jgi:hypothetical protein
MLRVLGEQATIKPAGDNARLRLVEDRNASNSSDRETSS